jgi:hypothetical protein
MDDIGDRANHLAADKPMMTAAGNVLGRSSVDDNGMGNDVSLHNLNFLEPVANNPWAADKSIIFSHNVSHECHDIHADGFLEPGVKQVEHGKGSSLDQKKGVIHSVDFQVTVRDASSLNNTGESSIHSENSSTYGTQTATSLSLADIDHVSHCPTIEEVIAFGGIPKPTFEVRSSTRLGRQPNADMPQMEKAMKMAQMRDESTSSGQFVTPMHSILNIPDSEIVKKADRLGISLGKSIGEIDKSIKGLKMVEEQRILTILEKIIMKRRLWRMGWGLLFCQKYPPFVRI